MSARTRIVLASATFPFITLVRANWGKLSDGLAIFRAHHFPTRAGANALDASHHYRDAGRLHRAGRPLPVATAARRRSDRPACAGRSADERSPRGRLAG